MAKFLVVLVVLCVSTALYVWTASGLNLENICPLSIFSYEGTEVNAFHRVRQVITFEPLPYYLVNHNIICDPNEFKNRSNHLVALRAKNRYNRKIAEIYSDRALNSLTVQELMMQGLQLGAIGYSIYEMWFREEKEVKCLDSFKETMLRGVYLLYSLGPFLEGRLTFIDGTGKPNNDELLAELKKTIEGLQIEEDSQTFAFRSHPIDKIYNKHIVLKGNFEFEKEVSDVYRQRGRLFYDLILPFNNRNPPGGRCFQSEELPAFYRTKL